MGTPEKLQDPKVKRRRSMGAEDTKTITITLGSKGEFESMADDRLLELMQEQGIESDEWGEPSMGVRDRSGKLFTEGGQEPDLDKLPFPVTMTFCFTRKSSPGQADLKAVEPEADSKANAKPTEPDTAAMQQQQQQQQTPSRQRRQPADEEPILPLQPSSSSQSATPTPCTGMDLNLFFAFAQCSLKMEARALMSRDLPASDTEAERIWPKFEQMAMRNLGKNEKWVPWHTVLGVHELFVVREIHHAKVSWWTDYHRFVVMFIFRTHCKRDLFSEVQMPHLTKEEFWKDLNAGFEAGCQMEEDMLAFRKVGARALQTSCFLIIPERLLPNDDQNLVRNITLRTQRLIALAGRLWPMLREENVSAHAMFDRVSREIGQVRNLGDTWVKMLMVCIDICLPHLGLLRERCEVGIGAADPMRKLLEDEGLLKPKLKKEQLATVVAFKEGISVNTSFKHGSVALRKDGRQLVQVTKGQAGSFDRAHAVAEALAEFAVEQGLSFDKQAVLLAERQRLLQDASLEVPELGLDAKMEELLALIGAGEVAGREPASEALATLCTRINESKIPSAKAFWKLVTKVETHARKYFKDLPLVVAQMKTERKLTAGTLQVQLCEFRQFQNFLQRPALKRQEPGVDPM